MSVKDQHPAAGLLISARDAADVFGLNIRTIHRWIAAGRLRAFGSSKTRVYVLVSDLMPARPGPSQYPEHRVSGLKIGKNRRIKPESETLTSPATQASTDGEPVHDREASAPVSTESTT